MNTEIEIILAIMEGSYGYGLRKNVGVITFENMKGVQEIHVDPHNFEKAYVINHLLNYDNHIDQVLECKTILLGLPEIKKSKSKKSVK